MSYWLGVIGALVFADGLASLYTYTTGEKAYEQSWLRDHSLRIFRCVLGIAIVIMGFSL